MQTTIHSCLASKVRELVELGLGIPLTVVLMLARELVLFIATNSNCRELQLRAFDIGICQRHVGQINGEPGGLAQRDDRFQTFVNGKDPVRNVSSSPHAIARYIRDALLGL